MSQQVTDIAGDILASFKGKSFLVTGGTGSIGSQIVRSLLEMEPRVVRIFTNDENALFNMQQEFANRKDVRFLLGDIRDRHRVVRAAEGVDYIFHAAALKHVTISEYNPFEAVQTNINGTQNVVDAALENDVEMLVSISTDKAVNPINTMGATKLLSEKLVTDAMFYKGGRNTLFTCVRFGNVLGSRGSVIPIFRDQVAAGGPVTVTSSEMTRFIMTIRDAVALTFKAATLSRGGEIFIFKMPAIRIPDLARSSIAAFASEFGHDPSAISIKEVGVRPGEKIHEELMTLEESGTALETGEMFIVLPEVTLPHFEDDPREYPGAVPVAQRTTYASNSVEPMTGDALTQFLLTNMDLM